MFTIVTITTSSTHGTVSAHGIIIITGIISTILTQGILCTIQVIITPDSVTEIPVVTTQEHL
jgi:hypothetical protein